MKNKYSIPLTLFAIFVLVLSACNLPSSTAATSTPPPATTQSLSVTLPAGSFPTSHPVTPSVTPEPFGKDCTDVNHMFAYAKCMAKKADGTYLHPAVTVGCSINGQTIGTMSPYAVADKPFQILPCDAPLYPEGYIFENAPGGGTTRFGPGSQRGNLEAHNFPELIWFMPDGTGAPNNTKVKVLGCHADMTGYMQDTLPQYEIAGFGRVLAQEINFRVLIELEGRTTWIWGGSIDGATGDTLDFSQYNPVCKSYLANAAPALTPTVTQ